jgi:hypothetical protein
MYRYYHGFLNYPLCRLTQYFQKTPMTLPYRYYPQFHYFRQELVQTKQ